MLKVQNFPDPFDPSTPIPEAVGTIESLAINFGTGHGEMRLAVFRTAAAAANPGARPCAYITVQLGEEFANGQHFPTVAEAMQDGTFAASWGSIRGLLYGWAKRHPSLAQAVDFGG